MPRTKSQTKDLPEVIVDGKVLAYYSDSDSEIECESDCSGDACSGYCFGVRDTASEYESDASDSDSDSDSDDEPERKVVVPLTAAEIFAKFVNLEEECWCVHT